MAIYTPFQLANMPGSPYAANPSAQGVYRSIAAQMQPQQAGVFVTPNEPTQRQRQQERSKLTPIPEANPLRMQLARQMMATGSATTPVRSPLEGLARTLTGIAGGYFAGEANRAEQAREGARGERLASLLGISPEEAQGLSTDEMLAVGTLRAQEARAEAKQPPETWRPATTEEITQANLPAAEPWLISSRGNFQNPTKSSQVINVGAKAESKLFEELVKGDAARIKAANEEVDQLRNLTSDLKILDATLEKFPSGALAPAKLFFGGIAESLGMDVEGVAEGQLANAVINRLIPRMRVTGSGTSSDRDMAAFRASLPNLSNTVEGNRMIVRYFDKMMKRKAAEAEFLRGYAEENKSLKGATEAMIAAEDRGELAPAFSPEEREALLASVSEQPAQEYDLTAEQIGQMGIEEILGLDETKLTDEQKRAVGDWLDKNTPDL